MGSLAKDDSKLFQNSISYLHNISDLNFSPPALKCVYLTKARLMELRNNIRIPSNNKSRCQRCFLNLIDGPASYRIKAEEKKSKFAKRMLVKSGQNKPMTKYQRKYFKRLSHFNGNHLVITCKYCKKDFVGKLDKSRKVKSKSDKVCTKKKKKNKRKDKFCGLNQELVASLTPQKVGSLTPQKVGNLDSSDFIPLEGNKKLSRVKLSKRKSVKETVLEISTKERLRKSQDKLKKKNKLKEFLNTSSSNKVSPSTNLKQFLQTL